VIFSSWVTTSTDVGIIMTLHLEALARLASRRGEKCSRRDVASLLDSCDGHRVSDGGFPRFGDVCILGYRVTGDLPRASLRSWCCTADRACSHRLHLENLRRTLRGRKGGHPLRPGWAADAGPRCCRPGTRRSGALGLFLSELENLLDALDVRGDYHLLGQSWGRHASRPEHAVRSPRGLRSLILSNSPASMPLWLSEARSTALEDGTRVASVLDHHEPRHPE